MCYCIFCGVISRLDRQLCSYSLASRQLTGNGVMWWFGFGGPSSGYASHWFFLRSSGFNHRHIVIVGAGDQATVVADGLLKWHGSGLKIRRLSVPAMCLDIRRHGTEAKILLPSTKTCADMLMIMMLIRCGSHCRIAKRNQYETSSTYWKAAMQKYAMCMTFLNTSWCITRCLKLQVCR